MPWLRDRKLTKEASAEKRRRGYDGESMRFEWCGRGFEASLCSSLAPSSRTSLVPPLQIEAKENLRSYHAVLRIRDNVCVVPGRWLILHNLITKWAEWVWEFKSLNQKTMTICPVDAHDDATHRPSLSSIHWAQDALKTFPMVSFFLIPYSEWTRIGAYSSASKSLALSFHYYFHCFAYTFSDPALFSLSYSQLASPIAG